MSSADLQKIIDQYSYELVTDQLDPKDRDEKIKKCHDDLREQLAHKIIADLLAGKKEEVRKILRDYKKEDFDAIRELVIINTEIYSWKLPQLSQKNNDNTEFRKMHTRAHEAWEFINNLKYEESLEERIQGNRCTVRDLLLVGLCGASLVYLVINLRAPGYTDVNSVPNVPSAHVYVHLIQGGGDAAASPPAYG